MKKAEREVIQDHAKAALKIWRYRPETGKPGEIATVTFVLCKIPCILDALDKAEANNKFAADRILDLSEALEKEKSRAEALERAIKAHREGRGNMTCFSCDNSDVVKYPCTRCMYDNFSDWKLHTRFEKEQP